MADFFLSPTNESDDFRFRAAARKGKVDHLVDGIPTFQAMERALARAQRYAYLTFWIFNPSVPLTAKQDVNAALKERGIIGKGKSEKAPTNWGELLGVVARAGADVRLLISDFDPIIQWELHAVNWRAYRLLLAESKRPGGAEGGGLRALCTRHPRFWTRARLVFGTKEVRTILEPALDDFLAKRMNAGKVLLNPPNPAEKTPALADMPGLFPSVTVNANTRKVTKSAQPLWRLWIASHHQKTAVIDDTVGFCGGLDVQTGRVDNPQHTGMLWHDAHLRLEGEVVGDLRRSFVNRWNRERPAFNDFIAATKAAKPAALKFAAEAATELPLPTTQPAPVEGPAMAQLLRTVSDGGNEVLLPTPVRTDIESAYKLAISQAEHFVYIENQYLRAQELADWLINRQAVKKDLALIIVLPVAPEEAANPADADKLTKHGLYLQARAVKTLRDDYKGPLGVHMLVKNRGAEPNETVRAGKHPSPQVYVHTKALIVDDTYALVGSPNTTLRSFRLDTEAAIGYQDPAAVRKLRLDLWGELLGYPADLHQWQPGEFVPKWKAIADANQNARAKLRKGWAIPYDDTGRKGESLPWIEDSDELAGTFDVGPDLSPSLPA